MIESLEKVIIETDNKPVEKDTADDISMNRIFVKEAVKYPFSTKAKYAIKEVLGSVNRYLSEKIGGIIYRLLLGSM